MAAARIGRSQRAQRVTYDQANIFAATGFFYPSSKSHASRYRAARGLMRSMTVGIGMALMVSGLGAGVMATSASSLVVPYGVLAVEQGNASVDQSWSGLALGALEDYDEIVLNFDWWIDDASFMGGDERVRVQAAVVGARLDTADAPQDIGISTWEDMSAADFSASDYDNGGVSGTISLSFAPGQADSFSHLLVEILLAYWADPADTTPSSTSAFQSVLVVDQTVWASTLGSLSQGAGIRCVKQEQASPVPSVMALSPDYGVVTMDLGDTCQKRKLPNLDQPTTGGGSVGQRNCFPLKGVLEFICASATASASPSAPGPDSACATAALCWEGSVQGSAIAITTGQASGYGFTQGLPYTDACLWPEVAGGGCNLKQQSYSNVGGYQTLCAVITVEAKSAVGVIGASAEKHCY